MAEVLIRFTGADLAFAERVLYDHPQKLSRVVMDAHTAASDDAIAIAARTAGTPVLIDPQTYLLQDTQYPGEPWSELTFADPAVLSPADFTIARADRLVADVCTFQMEHGATALIAPYVHIERASDGWLEVQLRLFRRTQLFLDQQGIRLPVTGVLAVSWRLLGRSSWTEVLNRLMTGLVDLDPSEVALAASRVDHGAHPENRLPALLATIARIRRQWPVITWNQGVLGEACIVAGASGYESGIGWGERCDLKNRMTERRAPRSGAGARPVYIPALGRSIPKRTVAALLDVASPEVVADLVCRDPNCCSAGRKDLMGDMRSHAVTTRAARLERLARSDHPRWAWNLLAVQANAGMKLAVRINHLAGIDGRITRVDTSALQAIALAADMRRQSAATGHAA